VDAIAPHPLWPENEPIKDLALQCHWERAVGGFGGQVWQGVRSAEVESTLRTHRIPSRERAELLGWIQLFVNVACGELNKREAERAEENRS